MTEMRIDLETLRKVQKAGNVLNEAPSNWELLDLPEDLLDAYKQYVIEKSKFNIVLEKYCIKQLD